MQSYAAFKAGNYFNGLDGLRAISILFVLLHHVPDVPDGPLRVLQENGRYGVSLFFVISGFLICTLLLREEEQNGRIALGKFYARRSLRLLPLYYAVLIWNMILVFGLHQYSPENQALFRAKLPSYLFYFSNWLPTATQGPFFCSWSLAVEEQFYLAFSLLLLLIGRRRLLPVVISLLGLKIAVYNSLGNVDVHSALWRVVFSYQEPILFGVLLSFALNQRRGYEALAAGLASPWSAIGLGLLTTTWLATHPMETQSTWDAQFLFVLMTLLVAALVVRARTPLLSGRVLSHVGKISYGIYLLHPTVINVMKKTPLVTSPLGIFFAATMVVIVLASVVYRFFELPLINYYKRRYSAARRSPGMANSPVLVVCPDGPLLLPANAPLPSRRSVPVDSTVPLQVTLAGLQSITALSQEQAPAREDRQAPLEVGRQVRE